MNKLKFTLWVALAILALSTPTVHAQSFQKMEGTVIDRITKTNTIRCGYFVWPPFISKDPNTGKLSGVNYDIMEAIGKNLNFKIDWTLEVGVGDVATALDTNKFDVMCASVWPSPARLRSTTLSLPTFYNVAHAFVRSDDKRFDGDLMKANNKSIKVVGIDADVTQDLIKERLPLATRLDLAQTASGSELLLQVVSKKADITFVDQLLVNDFLKNNPGAIRRVENIPPVRYYGELLSVKNGEFQLKNMLDVSIMQLTNDGVLEDIVKKYNEKYKAILYAPSKTFKAQ